MSGSAIGVALVLAAVALVLGFVAWTLIRALLVNKRIADITAKPAFRAAAAIPSGGQRIAASIQRLTPLAARLDGIARDLEIASAAGATLVIDIRLVAAATEELLDALVPAMRGIAEV